MSDLPLKATFKSGAGYDAPWLTVDAADPDDLSFKLDAILGGDSLQKVVEVASLFQAARNVEPGPQQQALPQGSSFGGGDRANAPTAGGWGNRPQQQSAPPQQQGGGASHPNAVLHPEGNACEQCGKVLEFKKTQSGKAKWQCPDWRWNNGNPNGHGMEWAN